MSAPRLQTVWVLIIDVGSSGDPHYAGVFMTRPSRSKILECLKLLDAERVNWSVIESVLDPSAGQLILQRGKMNAAVRERKGEET